jgi:N6-adenosine-specific RNA methylase IME4
VIPVVNFHPLANIFPLIDGQPFADLVGDVIKHGVREPVWLYEGQILDGRNRWRAAEVAGVECPTVEYKGDDPLEFVLSLNLRRRHMNASQLAFVALEIEKYEAGLAKNRQRGGQGGVLLPALVPEAKGEAREKAAAAVGVSARYVQDAKKIEAAAPELADAVQRGTKTLTQAVREVKESAREQRREENRELISQVPSPARSAAKFATIVIDPPWDWGDEGDADQLGRARPTYGTMTFEQLMSLPVENMADVDCHLYLWITNRSLSKGFALMERWGFRYITALTWCKPSIGMGNYFRGSTEHVLFGVRGSQQLKRKDVGTWFAAPRGPNGHSSKPSDFYPLVESCSPGPYLEMFARTERAGWLAWGAEANAA